MINITKELPQNTTVIQSEHMTTMDNNGQQWITMDNNGQQWTTMDNNGQQWTTMDNGPA